MNYNNKDIFLQRATSGGTFEEYKLTMQTSSVLMPDLAGNLFMTTPAESSATSSWALTAISASAALNAVTASYAVSASYEIVFETSASHAEEADVALEASSSISASYVPNLYPQQVQVSASWASASLTSVSASWAPMPTVSNSSSWASSSVSSSYAAYADRALSASYAPDSGVAINAETASLAYTASHALQALSASWAPQPVVPTTVASASWASSSISASYAPAPTSASYALSASYAPGSGPSIDTAYTTIESGSVSASAAWVTCSFATPEQYLTITTGNDYWFTSSNLPTTGNIRDVTVYINNTAAQTSSITIPSSWKNLGGTWPTYLTASKSAILSLRAYGPSTIVGSFNAEL